MFKSAAERVREEASHRKDMLKKVLSFGVPYLNDSLGGIFPNDLVVVGAPSGAGKTQFCVATALKNLEDGRRVHFIALEAEEFEIERRLKYQHVANFYFSEKNRIILDAPLNYFNWISGKCGRGLDRYESLASDFCEKTFGALFTFYKLSTFNVDALNQEVGLVSNETDLIIVDHVHYFDWDDDNDNRAVKKIAMAARDLCLTAGKPMILVSHLRKRDRAMKELVAGLDEFHGSSELYKIATKVITLASGGPVHGEPGKFKTYFRTPKNRMDGGCTRYLAETIFDAKRGQYESKYKLGWSNAIDFGEIDPAERPDWARRSGDGLQRDFISKANGSMPPAGRVKNYAPSFNPSERD